MKKAFVLVLLLTSGLGRAGADETTRRYTRPTVPTQDSLDRFNLKMAWHIFVPMDGKRDGFFSVQVLGSQILVQTRSGLVLALDAKDGSTLWRATPGASYQVDYPVGFNSQTIFVVRGGSIYALDRKAGHVEWEFVVSNGMSSAPVADEKRIFLCTGVGRLEAYEMPPSRPASRPGGKKAEEEGKATAATGPAGPQPEPLWNFLAETYVEQAPLLSEDSVVFAGTDGTFFSTSKYQRQLQYQFKAESLLAAPMGQHGDTAYVASRDFNVYALNIVAGRITWRFTGGAAILRKPEVTDEDVYVSPNRVGLYRLNRLTGETIWHSPQADRFLAANKKLVYAADRNGRLLLLDRDRGTRLASFDISDFVFPISNEQTDRFFLASNDGLIICLHDRENVAPLVMKKGPETSKPDVKPPPDKKPGGGQ